MIETNQLTKRYGDLIAVNNINLKLSEGDVFGFIGPNGSGKTTTMRMLATLLSPDYGEAYVCGKSIYTHPQEIRRLVGFMPDFFGVYDDMTVIEYLEFFAAAYRINGPGRRKVCEEKLELVDMAFKRDAMVNQLSRGQTQRIGLARVLLHEPQVLLLDEPASGLDPRARIEIRNLLKKLGEMKKTVIVSSHILPELADVCTRVGHPTCLLRIEGVRRRQKIERSCSADHLNLELEAHPGLLEHLAEVAVDHAHRREVLHAGEAELLELAEEARHGAERVGPVDPCEHRRVTDDRQNLGGHLDDDRVCIPVREESCG